MNINIVETVGLLTRCSFDEKYRDPIISLGGVQTLAELLLVRPELRFLFQSVIVVILRRRTACTTGRPQS